MLKQRMRWRASMRQRKSSGTNKDIRKDTTRSGKIASHRENTSNGQGSSGASNCQEAIGAPSNGVNGLI